MAAQLSIGRPDGDLSIDNVVVCGHVHVLSLDVILALRFFYSI